MTLRSGPPSRRPARPWPAWTSWSTTRASGRPARSRTTPTTSGTTSSTSTWSGSSGSPGPRCPSCVRPRSSAAGGHRQHLLDRGDGRPAAAGPVLRDQRRGPLADAGDGRRPHSRGHPGQLRQPGHRRHPVGGPGCSTPRPTRRPSGPRSPRASPWAAWSPRRRSPRPSRTWPARCGGGHHRYRARCGRRHERIAHQAPHELNRAACRIPPGRTASASRTNRGPGPTSRAYVVHSDWCACAVCPLPPRPAAPGVRSRQPGP